IVHAVDDCRGLNPGEHELDAVRIENIYRRAAGLCQRSRYGDELLPDDAIRPCAAGGCACARPPDDTRAVSPLPSPSRRAGATQAADTARASSATEADRAR